MALGTTLPTSAPENRMMAQPKPTMAPAHLRRGARLVEQEAGIHRQRAAKASEHRGQQIGEPVGAEFLIEVGGLLPRHLQARHIEQQRDGHHAAKRADLGAAIGDHAPIDVLPHDRAGRPPQRELAETRQEPGAAHRFVGQAEQAPVEQDQKDKERDRQCQIIGYPAAEQRNGDGEQQADENLRPIDARIQNLPNSTATATDWSGSPPPRRR